LIFMAFTSIYVPEFVVQAVVRVEPALWRRAIALVDETPPLWSVVAASHAAMDAGIQIGMAKAQAAQFPVVEIRQRSRARENAAHAALLDLGWSFSPRVEDTAPDTIIIDLTGLSSLFGSEQEIANQITERAFSMELHTRVAIAANPDASLHAARSFPGTTIIPPDQESQRLAGLPVHVLGPPLYFCHLHPDPEILEVTIARLAHLVGDANVGSPEITNTHRPGAFRMGRFIPPRPEEKMPRNIFAASSAIEKLSTRAKSGYRKRATGEARDGVSRFQAGASSACPTPRGTARAGGVSWLAWRGDCGFGAVAHLRRLVAGR
jgi:hypothetical protein